MGVAKATSQLVNCLIWLVMPWRGHSSQSDAVPLTKFRPWATLLAGALVSAGCISLAYIFPTIPQVETYSKANTKINTITNQRAAPPAVWTLFVTYKHPIIYMHPARPSPPTITEVLRPQRSAHRVAGIEIASISIADRPDARNEAVPVGKPAWTKSIGAYYKVEISADQELPSFTNKGNQPTYNTPSMPHNWIIPRIKIPSVVLTRYRWSKIADKPCHNDCRD